MFPENEERSVAVSKVAMNTEYANRDIVCSKIAEQADSELSTLPEK